MNTTQDFTLANVYSGGNCGFCQKTFSIGFRPSCIRRHERVCSSNPDKKIWRCKVCDKAFPHGSGLFKHRKSVAHRLKGGAPPKPRSVKQSLCYPALPVEVPTEVPTEVPAEVPPAAPSRALVLPAPAAVALPQAVTLALAPAPIPTTSELLITQAQARVVEAEGQVVKAQALADAQMMEARALVIAAQADVVHVQAEAQAKIALGQQKFEAVKHPLLKGVPQGVYGAILVDPPFRYSRAVGKGIADNHYKTMDDTALEKLQVKALASKKALLFMWCSGPTMARAIALCERWGFNYKTIAFVWVETNNSGKPQSMGLGSYTRPGAEYLLVAGRNSAASLVLKRIDQVFSAPRRAHSQKPEVTRNMIDEMIGDEVRKIELFSRGSNNEQWDVWGDELDTMPAEPISISKCK